MLGAIPLIRHLRDHWRRRVRRIELLALGGRADFNVFGHRRAYAVGSRDAVEEVVRIIDGELAKQGLAIRDDGPLLDDPNADVAYLEQQGEKLEVEGFHPLPYSAN